MTIKKLSRGAWAWFGNANHPSLYLATIHSGRRFVMEFVRWGAQGAQPRFQVKGRGMIEAKYLLKFEVGAPGVTGVEEAKDDSSVYRMDVQGVDHPDARLISTAPELYDALEHAVEIAEGKCDGNWDDLLPYHAVLRKVDDESA